MRTTDDVRDLVFEDLFKLYGRLIHKYCRFSIDGFTYEDIHQELCIVLLRCQQLYDPAHPRSAKFSTYFVNAMKWKIGNLLYRTTKRLSVWNSLEEAEDEERSRMVGRLHLTDTVAELELDEAMLRLDLSKLSPKATERCRKIMGLKRMKGLAFKIKDRRLIEEIKQALVGYNQE